MKVLIVNTSERTGGAAVAANRLLFALQKEGIDASMLVRDKGTNNPNVVSINTSWLHKKINFLRFVWERLLIFICNHLDREHVFRVSIANTGTNIGKHPLVKQADIIHLHWINHGFLSLDDIKKLSQLGKPIVWTMHDMWACTGICHHARECNKYQTRCQSCFFLHSSTEKDLSSIIFSKKKRIIEHANITFVACSQWLLKQAQTSAILQSKHSIAIPNPINRAVFCPGNVPKDRIALQLPIGKKLLLFGAANITDKRKGIDYLRDAVKYIKKKSDVEFVLLGQAKEELKSLFPFPVHFMGYLKNEQEIAALYNAVDVYVTPSLEENLPNTIMEAMACGTPCVGFHIGGIAEMIDHKVNGYVANYKDAEDLAAGIEWVFDNSEQSHLAEACIKKVQASYTESIVAGNYIALYNDLLSDKSNGTNPDRKKKIQ
jgi:glycosyltransferase involved in cell wall biosynthesis